MHGILLVDKPEGPTSNDVVRTVKRLVRPSKVGHSGTLDPAASGLMIILIGSATRSLDFLNEGRKGYTLSIRLGEETDTGDREGVLLSSQDPTGITSEEIAEALRRSLGVVEQVPPHHSAIKKQGVPLYKLARKGIFPELQPRRVEIFRLALLKWEPPFLDVEMVCSRGTYARAFARDIGRDLGVGGRLQSLRRTFSGSFSVSDAVGMEEVQAGGREAIQANLIPISSALSHIPDVEVSSSNAAKLACGNSIYFQRATPPRLSGPAGAVQDIFKVHVNAGEKLVLVKLEPKGREIVVKPVRVLDFRNDGSE